MHLVKYIIYERNHLNVVSLCRDNSAANSRTIASDFISELRFVRSQTATTQKKTTEITEWKSRMCSTHDELIFRNCHMRNSSQKMMK